MGKKLEKNLAKVQSIVDGTYGGKIQSGYTGEDVHANREIGDRWFDSDGKEWEKTSWGRKTVDKLPGLGLGDKCSDCEKLIIKKWDKDVHKADGRCYHCQIDFEAELKSTTSIDGKPGIRWFAYRRLRDLRNMDSLQKEMEQWIDELEKRKQEKVFDTKVANALANSEVEFTINKNKNIS